MNWLSFTLHMAGSIGMEINLAVEKLTVCCPPPIFNTYITNSKRLHFNIKACFSNKWLLYGPQQVFKISQFNKVSANLAYQGFIIKCTTLDELRCSDKCLLCRMLKIDILLTSCLLHNIPFIRWCAYIIIKQVHEHFNIKSANISYSTLSPNTITANMSSYVIHDIL